jgi:hypothetical protein
MIGVRGNIFTLDASLAVREAWQGAHADLLRSRHKSTKGTNNPHYLHTYI